MSGPGLARIGCSGWDYKDWRGSVYPVELPRRQWFSWYANHFDTVELNATFYRLPTLDTVRSWAAAAPEGFCYAVKLGQFGSHRMKLSDPGRWLPNHIDRLAALGPTAGPTLVQLPPHWRKNTERLDQFLAEVPPGRRFAVELRDPTWIDDDVFSVLARHDAALCVHDLLPAHPFEITTNWTYLRFHGPDARNHPYRGAYTGRRLWRVADRIDAMLARGVDVYAYFNNDFDGNAFTDATWLARHIDASTETTGARDGSAPRS